MSAYHTYGSTSLGLHTSGPQHKNMAQHLQHVTVMISHYQIYGWKLLMFQFPTDTLANSMHEKKQIQSHILHLITLTITKLAPNYTINHTSCTEKTYKLYYYIMHRNDEKPVWQQPRLNTHKLRRTARTIGATSPQHHTTQKKEKNFQPRAKSTEKRDKPPWNNPRITILCHYYALLKMMLKLHRVEI